MKNKHTYSSASSAYRWLNCTKSTELVKLVPEPDQSKYAEEGTKAHEELAAIVNRYINNDDKLTLTDIRPEWRTFLDHLDEYKLETIEIEQKVTFAGITGTLDYSWTSNGIIHIRDLKWGEGQLVESENNAQMAFYAVALANKYGMNKFDSVCIGIYQPRKTAEDGGSPFTYWHLSIAQLLHWATEFNLIMNKIYNRDLEYKQGPWCSWCPAHPICPEFKRTYNEVAEMKAGIIPAIENLDVKQVEQIALHGNDVIKWIESVQRLAYKYAINGMSFENLKLVNGTGRRQWLQEENKVAEELISIGVKDPWTKKLKGLTEIEKEIGKNKINHLTIKPDPKPSLVPIGDRRLAITLESPEDVFDDI